MNKQIEDMKNKIDGMTDQEVKAALYDNQIANEALNVKYTGERTTIAGERKMLMDALKKD